jgi:Domain of unknown function (DUF4062)
MPQIELETRQQWCDELRRQALAAREALTSPGSCSRIMKAFVSSTFKDLEEHRAKVIAGLRKLPGVQVLAMEDWAADPNQPKRLCLERVRACDVFIAIVGHLHGYIPEGDGHSITQSEYEEALAEGKPILAFVAADNILVSLKLLRQDSNLESRMRFVNRS